MKKLKDKSTDKPLNKLTSEISKLVAGSIPVTDIEEMIKGVSEMYADVQIDISPICIMVVAEAKAAGRSLPDHFKIFREEMKEIEAKVAADMNFNL